MEAEVVGVDGLAVVGFDWVGVVLVLELIVESKSVAAVVVVAGVEVLVAVVEVSVAAVVVAAVAEVVVAITVSTIVCSELAEEFEEQLVMNVQV